jgi:transcriptional regulator with XRE-family HTH domain
MSEIQSSTIEIERRIGRALRQWRIDAGFSQDELADRASLSRSAIQSLETGRGSRIETLVRALRALDRLGALDDLTPRTGPSPIERLHEQRRAARGASRVPRVGRKG